MDGEERVLNQACDLFDAGYMRAAYECLLKYTKQEEVSSTVLYWMGEYAAGDGMWEESLEAYTLANALNPNDVLTLCGIADCMIMLDYDENEVYDFIFQAHAIALDTKQKLERIYLTLALKMEHDGNYESAIKIYEEYNENCEGSDSYIECRIGWNLLKLGYYQDAAEKFKLMVADRPAVPQGWECLAYCYEMLDMPDDAMQLYSMLVKKHPSNGRVRACFARTLFHSGRVSEAQSEIAQALRDNPDDEFIMDLYNEIMNSDDGGDESGEANALFALCLYTHIMRRVGHTN